MNLKDFTKFIRGKSFQKLLHRARRDSLDRIQVYEKALRVSAKSPFSAKKAGVR